MFSGFALIVVRFLIGMVYLTRWTSRPVDPFIGLGIEQYCGICAIALMLLGFMIGTRSR